MRSEAIRPSTLHRLSLCGRKVECRLVRSKHAKHIRIKVTLAGLEVVVPEKREQDEALTFVRTNQKWVSDQLERAKRLHLIRRPDRKDAGRILFRGETVSVRVISEDTWRAPSRVTFEDGVITVLCGIPKRVPFERSLENWLRKQAREQIAICLRDVTKRLNREPNRIYVMGQRTKWGNCSSLGNLSFNWRLIMAPDYVLKYIVTHEVVHLAIPDHSAKFWLTVQSICREAERARQWLVANGHRLTRDFSTALR